ncbi:MAG: hypothetical protein BAA04_05805 [Firmicutes bacterium ZCTH02-B6]|nr:MAG: hypothetical protein BAA04_05805 [Firmicutes bacterium ZCTH02-B6]
MQTGPGLRRRFAITVDGVRHEVLVEELPDAEPAASPPSTSPSVEATLVASPQEAPALDSAGNEASGPGSSGLRNGWLTAPMPGTVTEVRVQPGDRVRRGDILLVLTAMKMENEIPAPVAGFVQAVGVAAGDTVNSGDRLVQLVPGEV